MHRGLLRRHTVYCMSTVMKSIRIKYFTSFKARRHAHSWVPKPHIPMPIGTGILGTETLSLHSAQALQTGHGSLQQEHVGRT